MLLYGDYHTHTRFSHGKGTVDDNVKAAAEKGLKQIAITDHGLKHIAFGLKNHKLARYTQEIKAAAEKYGISVLKGVEANITSEDGQIDLTDTQRGQFDIILCGYHKFICPKSIKDFFCFFLPNYFLDFLKIKSSAKRVRKNTHAVVENIRRFPVDVFTHVNYGLRVNCKEIAEACAKYGTYLEINGKRITYTDEEMREMLATGVMFIVNSDAHSRGRIGEVNKSEEIITRLNIPHERIVNIDKEPKWRSHGQPYSADGTSR